MKIEYDRNEILELIRKITERTMRMDLTWDWPCGVAYYGICRAFEATGDESLLAPVKERTDELIELGLPAKWTVNTCSMGHPLLTLYETYGEEKYLELLLSKIDHIEKEAVRFGDGVLQHTVAAGSDFNEQCWADTLFMAAYLLLRVGVRQKDQALIDDALNQYYWHIRYLQEPSTGLWYHGYDNIHKDHMSGIHWGRANAWAAYTMSRAGVVLPEAYLYPKYMDIAGSLNELLSGLKLLQTENGLFRTVLDDPLSYEEVSASAGISAAMLEKGNPLHLKYVKAAVSGLLSNISPDGRVLNVSAGTAVMKDAEGYRGISRDWIQGWGQGLMLAFLSALLESENRESDGAL